MTEARYTHGHAESVLRSHRWRTAENSAGYLLPHLAPGQRLLDVGAGPGTITADLATRVAPGRVTALEATEDALTLSRDELGRRGIDADFVVGDVHALELDDDSFDVVHAHQVLQHLADPVQALREMRRVCKPGGIVAVRDSDYAGFVWYPETPAFDRWMSLYQQTTRDNHGEPNAGRMLLGWAHAAGFTDVTPSAGVWCFATPEDRDYWGGMWKDRILASAFATQLLEERRATQQDLEAISAAWQTWAGDPDAWFTVLHGELICRV